MSSRLSRAVVWLLRLALALYPSRFRRRFESEILQAAHVDLQQSLDGGPSAFAATSAREVVQAVSGIIPQHRLERARRNLPSFGVRLMQAFRSLAGDVRLAVRALRQAPSFTVVALSVLALGIGASTAVFSVVDAVVLRGLPFDEQDRLVVVLEYGPSVSAEGQVTTMPTFLDWRREQRSFESIAGVARSSMRIRGASDEPLFATAMRVTQGFFETLRVRPQLGRTFTLDDESPSAPRVAAISHAFWQRHLGGAPDVIGRRIGLDDPWEIVAVMPEGFTYPVASSRPTDVYVPSRPAGNDAARGGGQNYSWTGIGRLRAGVSAGQAQEEMHVIMASLDREYPDWIRGSRARVMSLHHHLTGGVRSWMMLLLGSVVVVLLIACANVANLMLARATVREREMGIRSALGAGRWRLTRMLVVEGLVLSVAGAAGGLLIAQGAVSIITASLPATLPRAANIGVDLRVMAVAAAAAVTTGLLFGLLPALQSSRPDVARALRDGGRSLTSGRGGSLRSALVVSEVALAAMLLVGAGLFTASWVQLMRIDTGFNHERILTFGVGRRSDPRALEAARARGSEAVTAYFDDARRKNVVYVRAMLEAVGRVPGVAGVAAVNGGVPLTGSYMRTGVTLPEGQIAALSSDVAEARSDAESVDLRQVTTGYLEVLGLPLLKGRYLTDADAEGGIVINEAAALKYWPGRDALGQQIGVDDREAMRTVVGIVGDIRHLGPEGARRQEAYVPFNGSGGDLVIRTTGDPMSVLPAVKRAVWSVDRDQIVPDTDVTLESYLDALVAQRRFSMALLALLGALALVIAAAGVYGVMAYVVSQRTQEIGVRMALGARPADVVSMIMGRAGLLVAAGLVIGCAGAWYVSKGVQTFLFLVASHDWRVFAASAVVLSLTGMAACALPARRAAHVDPLIALRGD